MKTVTTGATVLTADDDDLSIGLARSSCGTRGAAPGGVAASTAALSPN